jgi:hypothetical protein
LYGDRHRFKLVTNDPCGACVRIEIPVRFVIPQIRDIA